MAIQQKQQPIQPEEGIFQEGAVPTEIDLLDESMARSDIESSFADLKNRDRALQSKKISDKNMLKEAKIQIIRKLFLTMKEIGVDLNDPASVRDFIEKLQMENPDLYLIFESAMNELLPDQGVALGETGGEVDPNTGLLPNGEVPSTQMGGGGGSPDSGGLMGKYKNLQQTIMRGQ